MSTDDKTNYLQTNTNELPTPDTKSVTFSTTTDAVYTPQNTTTTAAAKNDSIELIVHGNNANSVEIHEHPDQNDSEYLNTGSVQELPSPRVVPSPVSPSESDHSDAKSNFPDFPDTNDDPNQSLPNMQAQFSEETVPSMHSNDSEDIKAQDFADLKDRMETAHKLGGIDENEEEDYKRGGDKFTASTNLQNQKFYRIKKRFFRGYIRQDWHTYCVDDGLDELRAGWVELFFDLIFVACIVHLSSEAAHSIVFPEEELHDHILKHACDDGRYDFLLTAFAQFALLSAFWMEQVMYTTHFVLNEHIDELLRIFYMTFILAMGIFVANDPAYHIGFFSSYALIRIVSCCMFFRVSFIPRAKSHAVYHIVLHLCIIFVLIALIGFKFSGCALDYFAIYFSLWVVEYGSGVFQWTISNYCCSSDEKKKYAVALPLNVPHISERYGLFVMIILGEALIAVMTVDVGSLDLYQKFAWSKDGRPPDIIRIFFFLGIFILSYCIGRLYYNCQPTEEAILVGTKNHALRISKNRARVYIHSHQILFMALLGYSVGIKLAGQHVLETEKRWIDILLPGYSLFVIVLCLNIIRGAHPFEANKKVWTFRLIVSLILGICPLFAKVVNQALIWGVQLLCILGLVATDVEGEQKRKNEENQEDKKREAAKEHAELKEKHEKEKKSFRRHLRHMVSGIGLL